MSCGKYYENSKSYDRYLTKQKELIKKVMEDDKFYKKGMQ